MGIQHYLLEAAERYPDKPAISEIRKSCSYRTLLEGAKRIAAWLMDERVQTGDRIGILIDDPAEYAMAYFGILMAGGVVVAINSQTSARSLWNVIDDAEISVLLTHGKFSQCIQDITQSMPSLRLIALSGPPQRIVSHPRARCENLTDILHGPQRPGREERVPPDDPDALAQLVYTSGTTGKPKGVMLTHANLMANTRSIVEYLGLTAEERHMVVLSFFYSFGNSILLSHVAAGATMIVHHSMVYPKVVLDLMSRERATGLSGVPSTFAVLLSSAALRSYSFPCLRYIAQAGGPMSPRLAQQVKSAFPDADLYIMYGQTEASPRLSYLHPDDFHRKPGSIGKAIPGVTLLVCDNNGAPVRPGEIGEIVARGDNIMAGYWKDPEATARVLRKEGLWTGDMARLDDEGYLYVVGRNSEIIKSGAHRIGPREIEDVILEHPAVKEVAVFGIDDEILGEAIAACIIKANGAACSSNDILLHCRQILPAYKVPGHIFFVECFPTTPAGKVQKNELKKIVLAAPEACSARREAEGPA
jgi:acyl-CoA synthetase (AMP-forming)/AMP-acid ligase II